MAFATHPGTTRDWYPYDTRLHNANTAGLVLDSLSEQIAFGGQVWFKERTGTKQITRVGFNFTGENLELGQTELRVSLQDMSTTAVNRPDGTADQTYNIFAADLLGGWYRTGTLTTNRTVSYGERLCVVFNLVNHASQDRITIHGFNQNSRGTPWTAFRDAGGGWSVQALLPNVVLEFTDGTFGTLAGSVPYVSNSFVSYNFESSPDEYGIVFRVPWNCKVDALCAFGQFSGAEETQDAALSLYQGTTLLKQCEIDSYEIWEDSPALVQLPFTPALDPVFGTPLDPQVELTAGTDYIIAVRANSTADISLYSFTLNDGGHRACWGDLNIGQVTRTNQGAWSAATTTTLPRLGVRISSYHVGSSLVSYTLACNGGTYAVTGTAADFRRGRGLIAAGSSYAVTGTAASLKITRRVSAATTSYAVTGTAASLRRGRRLAADVGTLNPYEVNGFAAILRRGRKVIAASGSYSATGTAATLRVARKLVAALGSINPYEINGFAAILTYRPVRTLAANTASYAVTGTAASLEYGRLVAAGGGTYSLTGTAASLEYGRELAAAGSSYTLTGTAAGFLFGKGMIALSGSYVITGTAASPEYSRIFAAGSGSYTLTGTAATLKIADKLSAEAGSYAISGTAANLRKGPSMAAGASSYAINGTVASLLYGREVAAGAGSYAITGTAASLFYGRELAAGAGSYAISGQMAVLERGNLDCRRNSSIFMMSPWRMLVAVPNGSFDKYDRYLHLYQYCADFGAAVEFEGGSYTLSGTAASLEYSKLISVAAGSYTISGTAASLEFGHLLVAGGSSYTYTGTAASLRYGYELAAGSGNYPINGSNANLLATRRLTMDGGVYTWTGTAATVKTARMIGAGVGSYVITALETGATIFPFEPAWALQFNYLVDEVVEQ